MMNVLKILILFVFLFGGTSSAFAVDKYWVGGTGNWSDDDNHWSLTSGGAPADGNIPTSSDNCIFNGSSSAASAAYTVTVNVSATCADFTMGGPGAGNNVTWAGSSALNIAGSMNLSAGSADLTRTYTGAITFSSTASGKTLTFNGVTLASATTFDGAGGAWTLQDAWNNSASTITLTRGTLDTNDKTLISGNFSSTNSNTRSLSLGSSLIYVGNWDLTNVTGLTFNAETATITSTTTTNFQGGGLTYNDVIIKRDTDGGSGFEGANTFANLTITGVGAFRGTSLSIGANQIITGTLTINGNSILNRMHIFGEDEAIMTFTAATVTVTNTDFESITGAGAANWNLSAISGGSGDCGDNSGITFTANATQTWQGTTGGNWSNSAKWTSRVPLCQDDVIINNAFSGGQRISSDMVRLGRSINFTGVSGSPIWSIDKGNGVNNIVYGSLTLTSGVTVSGTSTNDLQFGGRGNHTLTSAGLSWDRDITVRIGTGVLTLQDDLMGSTTKILSIESGTFNANTHDVSTGFLATNNSAIATNITMGGGAWTLTGSNGSVCTCSGPLVTVTRSGNPVLLTYIGGTATRTITGAVSFNGIFDFDVASGTDGFSISGLVGAVDFTGFAGRLTNGARTLMGDMTLTSGMTLIAGGAATTFSTTTGTLNIDSLGKNFDFPLTFNGAGGTYKLSANLAVGVGTARQITLTAGTLDLNGKTLTHFGNLSSTGSGVRSLTFGGGTWDLTSNATTTVWSASGSNFTTSGTGTIKVSGSTVNTRTFAGGGFTYSNELWFSNATPNGRFAITGSSTYEKITVDTAPQTLRFTAGSINTFNTWNVSGTAGNLITIDSITAASHTLVKVGGQVSSDYLSINNSIATPTDTWCAGANSIDGGTNSGWYFQACPISPPSPSGVVYESIFILY